MIKSFLSDQCKEIILGSLLGDGSLKIHKPYKNARFSFKHSLLQKDYFYWKVNQLKEISGESCVWQQNNDGLGKNKLRYQSLALESLTGIYRLTSKNNKLFIRRKWLNELTLVSLMVWWLDDGSIISNGRKGVFCTDPFSLEEQKILARYLQKSWNIKVSIGKIVRDYKGEIKNYYRLWIHSSDELKKFFRIILPYIPTQSMLSKVMILYKDFQLQQRWISEINESTKFSTEEINKILEEKKSKWKAFRK